MKLAEWFTNDCPYPEGVALYAELGSNNALKTMLGFGETKFNARKLYAALEAPAAIGHPKKRPGGNCAGARESCKARSSPYQTILAEAYDSCPIKLLPNWGRS